MYIILLVISSFISGPACDRMVEVREAYGNIQSEKELISFIDLLDSFECPGSEPYMASAIMQKAQFAMAPWTKYNFFIQGKKQLENYISNYPKDLEARYIRFLIQSHAPFFLGYNGEKEEDTQLILENIDQSGLSAEYIAQIKKHISEFK